MTVYNNCEIIRRLYTDAASTMIQNADYKARRKIFTRYSASRPSSLKAFKNFFAAVSTAFPDYDLRIDNIVSRGDKVMARYTISGTQKRDFLGITPTNERTTVTGIDIFRLDNGKVAEHWNATHQLCACRHTERRSIESYQDRSREHFTASSPVRRQVSLSH